MPLTQDFESFPFTRFERNTSTIIPDFPEGEVIIGDGIGTIEESRLDFSNKTLRLRSTQSNLVTTAELVLTLDLSDKDVNSFLSEFSLDLYHIPASGFPIDDNDQIFIRGSENDTWLPIYDYGDLQDANDLFVRIVIREISTALQSAGQQYSSTFQIRILSQSGGELEIDNLAFVEVPDVDLDLNAVVGLPIVSPALGAQESVGIELINLGSNAITSFTANATISKPDGTQQVVSEVVNQTIAPLDTFTYTFGETFDLDLIGSYLGSFMIEVENDELEENDSLAIRFGKSIAFTESLPFIEDFQAYGSTFDRNDSQLTQDTVAATFEGLPFASIVANRGGFIKPGSNRDEAGRRINEFRGGVIDLGINGEGVSSVIYTIDMSQYDAGIDAIRFSTLFSTTTVFNNFFIRGSVMDEWIPLDGSETSTQLLIR
ncbi:MAG: hypothetical protein AAFY41_06345, partial [Bacteroidota bacterium]